MKRITLWILLFGTVAALVLSACSPEVASLDGTSWSLKSYQNEAGETVNITSKKHYYGPVSSG